MEGSAERAAAPRGDAPQTDWGFRGRAEPGRAWTANPVIGQPHTILSGSRRVTQSHGVDPGEANGRPTRLRVQSRPEPPRGWRRTRTRPPATAARAGGRRSAVGSTRTAFSGSGSDYRDATDVDPQPSPSATGRAAWSDHAVVVASRSRHAVGAPPRVLLPRGRNTVHNAPEARALSIYRPREVGNDHIGSEQHHRGVYGMLSLPRIADDLPAQRVTARNAPISDSCTSGRHSTRRRRASGARPRG